MFFVGLNDGTWVPCGPKQKGAVQTTMQDLAARGLASKVKFLHLRRNLIIVFSYFNIPEPMQYYKESSLVSVIDNKIWKCREIFISFDPDLIEIKGPELIEIKNYTFVKNKVWDVFNIYYLEIGMYLWIMHLICHISLIDVFADCSTSYIKNRFW